MVKCYSSWKEEGIISTQHEIATFEQFPKNRNVGKGFLKEG